MNTKEPIAVVGRACRAPGDCTSPSKLWSLLKEPRDVLVDRIPPSRFNPSGFYHQDGAEHHGGIKVSRSYLLQEDHRLFDASFFNIHPREAEAIDPQQRLLLETVYESLEDGGFPVAKLRGTSVGVYVGVMTADFNDIQVRDPSTMPQYVATGTSRAIVSNRISYFFDWNGPSMTIDTACSSSLVAVHLAVQSLRSGEVTSAVAAGSNLILGPEMYIAESKLNMLSAEGYSRMWDSKVDGYARGEGTAAVVLKTLSQAIADGDNIHCVIRETGLNQDGRTTGITMPSVSSQSALIREVYSRAGLDYTNPKERCQYFEAHGTGTAAGDSIEAEAIHKAFFGDPAENALDRPKSHEHANDDKLFVGSIKTVIGHLEGAAGLAGLLKASLAVKHGIIPPNLHFKKLNPKIKPFYGKLEIITAARSWPALEDGNVRRVSVNSFGFGGANAHAIVEQYVPPSNETRHEPAAGARLSTPLVFSATSSSSLAANMEAFADMFGHDDASINELGSLDDIAATLQSRRSDLPLKCVVSGATRQKTAAKIRSLLENRASIGTRSKSTTQGGAKSKLLGVFTGQGAQWPSMGIHLAQKSPTFLRSLQHLEAALAELPVPPQWSLLEELAKPAATSRISEAEISQPLCTAIQVGLVQVLQEAKITFDYVVGHSSGEIAAAYAAGFISARDAIKIAYLRGVGAKFAGSRGDAEQGKDRKVRGGMAAVGLSFEDAIVLCSQPQYIGRVRVAASNSPTSSTISGDFDAIEELQASLSLQGTFARLLKVDVAYHSHHMIPCAVPYQNSMLSAGVTAQEPPSGHGCTWISSVTGRKQDATSVTTLRDGSYWVQNMTDSVLFSQAVKEAHRQGGSFDIGLEIGPHPALKGPALDTLKANGATGLPYEGVLKRRVREEDTDDDIETLGNAVGFVWAHDSSRVDWEGYRRALGVEALSKPVADLPAYKWDHSQPFWAESRLSRNYRTRGDAPHSLLGSPCAEADSADEKRWRNLLKLEELPWLKGHKFQGVVLLPASFYVGLAVEAVSRVVVADQVSLIEVEDVILPRAVTLEEGSVGVEMIVSLCRDRTDHCLYHFSAFSCQTQDHGTLDRTATASIRISLGEPSVDTLPTPPLIKRGDMVEMDVDRLYQSIADMGLEYSGDFQRIEQVHKRYHYCQAELWKPSVGRGDAAVDPAFLDVCFHSVFAALCYPYDDTLWGPFLPTSIQKLKINLHAIALEPPLGVPYALDSQITHASAESFSADLHIRLHTQGPTMIQIENFTCSSVTAPAPENDRKLFLKTVWRPDIVLDAVSGQYVAEFQDAYKPSGQDLVHLRERLAYFHLRKLHESSLDRENVEWHYRHLLAWADRVVAATQSGTHPVRRPEWDKDTAESLAQMTRGYQDRIEIQILNLVGENLAKVVAGEAEALGLMMADDLLGRAYVEGFNFTQLNSHLANIVSQLSHRYPRMKILEIGAGTGSATGFILDALRGAYDHYAYTDISAGFFAPAKAKLAAEAGKMSFSLLDVEKDIEEQGFAPASYDLIVASNVLHATKVMKHTLGNVRKLLRPGGFLVLLEVTGDQLAPRVVVSPFEGWWLGAEMDGRIDGPCLSTDSWNALLQETGFSGVDVSLMDEPHDHHHVASVMLSQATDDTVNFLREPLKNPMPVPSATKLVVLAAPGCDSLARNLVSQSGLDAHLEIEVLTLEDITTDSLEWGSVVLSLVELQGAPVFTDRNPAKLQQLQEVFGKAYRILWTTRGANASRPHCNATVGLIRTLKAELPHLRVHVLDIEEEDGGASVTEPFDGLAYKSQIARAMWHLLYDQSTITTYGSAQDYEFDRAETLWTSEPEMRIVGTRLYLPRLQQDEELNNRLNASRRTISHQIRDSAIPGKHHGARLAEKDGTIYLEQASFDPSAEDDILTVSHSLIFPVMTDSRSGNPLYLCMGYAQPDGTHQTQHVALSEYTASRVKVSSMIKLTDKVQPGREAHYLHHVASGIAARLLQGTKTIIHNADPVLLSLLQGVQGITCSSSRRDSIKTPGVLWIHPQLAKSSVASLLRRAGCDRIIDFSHDPSPLQRASNVKVYDKLAPAIAADPRGLDLLGSVCSDYRGTFLADEYYAPAIKASELSRVNTRSPNDRLPWSTALDWTSGSFNVQVQPADSATLFSSNKTYLLVGLTRELGLSLAYWMASCGAQHLVLTSRNPMVDPLWIEDVQSSFGATVKVLPMDVCDADSIRSALDAISSSDMGLPPLGGAINGAMVLADRLFADMTFENMEAALAPKIEGSDLLSKYLPRDLDFFVLFSSVSGIVGKFGQANYNAANMYMASLARQRRAQGLATSVLNIGMVLGVGMVARNGTKYETPLRAINCMPIAEQEIHAMLAEAIMASKLDVGSGPWSVQRQMEAGEVTTGLKSVEVGKDSPPWINNPRFAHLIEGTGSAGQQVQDAVDAVDGHVRVSLEQQLDGLADEAQAAHLVEEEFASKIANLLQMSADKVPHDLPLIDLGVDSLLAVEIRTWLLHELGVDLPILKVLSGASAAELSAKIAGDYIKRSEAAKDGGSNSNSERSDDGHTDSSPRSSDKTPFTVFTPAESYTNDEQLLRTKSASRLQTTPRVGKTSYSQSRLWFTHQYLQDKTSCNISLSYNVEGSIDIDRLEQALQKLVEVHPALRSSFQSPPRQGEPLQHVLEQGSIPLVCQEVSGPDDASVEDIINSARHHVFDLEKGDTMRVQVVSWSPTQHILIFTYHHLIMDGISWRIFLQDLDRAYSQPAKPMRLMGDSLDFAKEQRQMMEDGKLAKELDFWRGQFSELPQPLPLLPFALTPTRQPLIAYEQVSIQVPLPATLMMKIRAVSRASSVTPFHFHLATLQLLLSKLVGVNDLCIGVADANRTEAQTAEQIGFFLNLLPIRFAVEPSSTVKNLLQTTRSKVFKALDNCRLPFDLILKAVDAPTTTTHSPLFQAIMNYRLGADEQSRLGSCDIAGRGWSNARTPYDLDVDILDRSTGDGLVTITTQEYLYNAEEARRLGKVYIHLLESLSTTGPEEALTSLHLYSAVDAQRSLTVGQGSSTLRTEGTSPAGTKTLSTLVQDSVSRYPDDSAIIDNLGNELTYRQTAALRDAIQFEILHRLEETSSPTQTVIAAAAIEPGAEYVCSMLAVLRLGGLFVPLDLRNPAERLARIIQNCNPSVVLCDDSMYQLATDLLATLGASSGCILVNVSSLKNKPDPGPTRDSSSVESNAFALYTSGSTGVPKGVLIRDRNLCNHLHAMSSRFGFDREVVLQQSSVGFDMSIFQIFTALINGGTVTIVPQKSRGDPVAVSDIMKKASVTMTLAAPSEYMVWLRYGGQAINDCAASQAWRFAFSGGEPVTSALCTEFDSLPGPSVLRLINIYGPTEVSVACSAAEIDYRTKTGNRYAPVGETLRNYSVYILDENQKPVPTGFPGEIFIGGAGVTSGYISDHELTQQRFLPDPFATAERGTGGWGKMYRSRDRGRLLDDGSLVFLGRMEGDTQVKLRGLRIELDEVAQALLHHGSRALTEVVVCARGEGTNCYLIAFVTCAETMDAGAQSKLFTSLLTTLPLPVYMRPATIVALPRLPQNANGKVDRRQLANLDLSAVEMHTNASDNSGALSDTETRMKACWEAVLPLDMLTTPNALCGESDFFRVGGNSLLLVTLRAQIQKVWGDNLDIPLADMFQACTLRTISALVEYLSTREPGKPEEQQPRLAPSIDWAAETSIASCDEGLSDFTDNVLKTARDAESDQGLTVLLTGATGFLGREILKQLASNPSVGSIHCVAIRPGPNDDETGGNSLQRRLSTTSPKAVAYAGDLALPYLGLPEDEFARLASTVDVIIHNGAMVSFMQTYQSLRGPNVSSTKELMRMALPRQIPLHYLSTAGIARLVPGADSITERTSLASFPPPTDGSDGYVAGKWASEQILRRASRKYRLPVHIHRPVSIVGEGAAATDLMGNLMTYARQLKTAPRLAQWTGFFDLVQVEHVAAEIVDAAMLSVLTASLVNLPPVSRLYSVYHESGGMCVPVQRMAEFVSRELGGAEVGEVPLMEWIDQAEAAGMPYTLASYLRSVGGLSLRVPRLLKERQRVSVESGRD